MHLICFPIYDIDLLLAGFLLSCNCGGQRGGQVDGHAAIHIPRLTGHIRGRIVSRPPPRPAALFACLLSPYIAFALLGPRGLFWVRAGVQHLKLIDNTSKSQFMPDDSRVQTKTRPYGSRLAGVKAPVMPAPGLLQCDLLAAPKQRALQLLDCGRCEKTQFQI